MAPLCYQDPVASRPELSDLGISGESDEGVPEV